MMPLLVIRLYGKNQWEETDHKGSEWQAAAKYFLPELFRADTARALGRSPLTGASSIEMQFAAAIGYSAIDEGTTLFGDTGIVSLFDDATDLGTALKYTDISQSLVASASAISQIFTQYAGRLALNKVMHSVEGATDGVVSLSEDGGALSVDFSHAVWGKSDGAEVPTAGYIPGRKELTDRALSALGTIPYPWGTAIATTSDIRTGLNWLYGDTDSSLIDRVNFQTRNQDWTTTLPGRSSGASPDKVTLTVAAGGNDDITGSADNDFIAGGAGNDSLKGGVGDDLLAGGDGDDVLRGGDGDNFLAGGRGYDTMDLGLTANSEGFTLGVSTYHPQASDQRGGILLNRGNGTDLLIDMERLNLTSASDRINIGSLVDADGNWNWNNFAIDMKSSDGVLQHQDIVDFSQLNTGVYFNAGSSSIGYEGAVRPLDAVQTDVTGGLMTWIGRGLSAVYNTTLPPAVRIYNANEVIGSQYDDILSGSSFKGNAGDISDGPGGLADDPASEGYSVLYGGAGSDALFAAGYRTEMYGGAGSDMFIAGAGAFINDGDTSDRVFVKGLPIFGGIKPLWMKGNYAIPQMFSGVANAFPVIGAEIFSAAAIFMDAPYMSLAHFATGDDGSLAIRFGKGDHWVQTVVRDYHLDMDTGQGTAGLTVFAAGRGDRPDGEKFGKFVNLALKAGFGIGLTGQDPIVFDLNGNGIELWTVGNSPVYIDLELTGYGQRTAWARNGDGILVRDTNANGTIDSLAEMFGAPGDAGFAALAAYDTNADGVIDAQDTRFAELRMWVDANEDGKTDAGELKTLQDLGIASISLASTTAENDAIAGSQVTGRATFTRNNGTTGETAEVVFTVDPTQSVYSGDRSVSAAAALLPQYLALGRTTDLRIAASHDATLLGQLQAFVATETTDLAILTGQAEDILLRWTRADGIAPTAIGSIDRQRLAALEALAGRELAPRSNGVISDVNSDELATLWQDTLLRFTLRIAIQGPLADLFSSIDYLADRSVLLIDNIGDLADVFSAVLGTLPSDPSQALAAWSGWAPLLQALTEDLNWRDESGPIAVDTGFTVAALQTALAAASTSFAVPQLAATLGISNVLAGTSGDDLLQRSDGGAFSFLSSGGTDRFIGGGGQDFYLIGAGAGSITITDQEGGRQGDTLQFSALRSDQVSAARDGNDLLLTSTIDQTVVRVVNQFADVQRGGGGTILGATWGIESILFADGTLLEDGLGQISELVGTGGDGDDLILGTNQGDYLHGAKGNDTLRGGDDGDFYYYDKGDGNDIVSDVMTNPLVKATDMLMFGTRIAPIDLTFSRVADGNDLIIGVGASGAGGSVTIQGQFAYGVLGTDQQFATTDAVELFMFERFGESYSNIDIQQLLIAQATTTGNDLAYGFGSNDQFYASAGDDRMVGLDGADRYRWGAGSGNDTIDERARFIDVNVGLGGLNLSVEADTLEFDASIDPSSLVFSRPTSAADLLITNTATGETLTVVNQFNGFQTGVLGAHWFDRVEWFEFANGSRLSWQDVLAIVTTGGAGDDQLWGDIQHDTLAGHGGNDRLSGRGGDDTYLFNLGDGHDTLLDDNTSFLGDGFITIDTAPDVLQFGAGIAATDIVFQRSGANIDLVLAGGDRVTLAGQDDYIQTGIFGALSYNRIEEIRFADGTVWTWQQLNQRMIAAQTTAGNDVTQGFTLEDRFEKSAGDDILSGGDSSDTYVFGTGAGHDRIRENVTNVLYGDGDVVEFDATVAPGDVTVSRDGDDLLFTLASGDALRVEGEFAFQTIYSWTDVELFKFADGTSWSKDDIKLRLLQSTPGADHLLGFHLEDDLDGGAGDDILEGADGSDTYHFDRGYGNDTIREWLTQANLADFDTLAFGPTLLPEDLGVARDGDDLVLTILDTDEQIRIVAQFGFANWFAWNDIELFTFANGTSWTDRDVAARLTGGTAGDDHILGTFRTDTLDGKAGNDLLEGGDGSDIYLFGYGYGQDEIREKLTNANLGEDDELRFDAGVTLEDLGFTRSGNDLIITLAGSSDRVLLTGEFLNSSWFSWNDVERFSFADGSFITRGDIQQILLTGTAGDDHLIGYFDANTLDGGAGDDLLEGRDGADTYVFGRGYGHDYIRETKTDGNLSDDDTVALAAGITPDDVTLVRQGYDLVIQLDTGDTLTIENHFTEGYNEPLTFLDIDRIRFASGEEWNKDAILLKVLQGTPGNDTLIGGARTDVLDGGAGDDWLQGEEGADQYVWGAGYGNDVIQERFNLVTRSEFDEVSVHGVAPADLKLTRNGNDVILTVATGETLTINGQLADLGWTDIEQINFDDGTKWSQDDILAELLRQAITPGDDVIHGFHWNDLMQGGAGNDELDGADGDDVFEGGTGDDYLIGFTGNDIYRFSIGDGHDMVEDERAGWDAGFDTVEFKTGIAPGDVTVSRDGYDILLTLSASGDSIRLNRAAIEVGVVSREIEQVRFEDGTIWTSAMVRATALTITSGNDVLEGSNGSETIDALGGNDTIKAREGNDVLIGGAGDDTLCGDGGNDVYRYALGDGNDTINDNIEGWGGDKGFDTLEFAAGIDPAMVNVAGVGNDFRITFTGQAGSLLLVGSKWQGSGAIERIVFANGTVWNYSDMAGRSLGATDGPDTITGSNLADVIGGLGGDDNIQGNNGNDILVGGTGNDRIIGGYGDDVYRFDLGDGQDIISEYGFDGFDRLEFGDGIAASDLRITQIDGGYDFVLKIAGTTDQVIIDQGNGWYREHRVDQISFADGTLWSIDDLLARIPTAGDDFIRGSIEANTIDGGAGNDTIQGDNGNDVLIGRTGNDNITGGQGDDVYRFDLGDGQDVISEFSANGFDRLEFGAGIAAQDVQITQTDNGYDFVLKIAGTADQVVIDQGNGWYWEHRVDQISFADGTLWSVNDLMTRLQTAGDDSIRGNFEANTINGGAGNDWIRGDTGNDVLSGGVGNDVVNGGPNDDIYLFNLGDGQDVISEYDDGTGGYDALVFGAGLSASDVRVTQANAGKDLILSFAGSTDQVTIRMVNAWSVDFRIEEVRFADGTTWSFNDLLDKMGTADADHIHGNFQAQTIFGRAGDDWIDGRDGNDILIGGTGNDYMSGGGGNDVYRFARGDGQDTIREYIDYDSGWWGTDAIEFAPGITPGDVTVGKTNGGNDYVFYVDGGASSITVSGGVTGGVYQAVEEFRFADGTVWSLESLADRIAPSANDGGQSSMIFGLSEAGRARQGYQERRIEDESSSAFSYSAAETRSNYWAMSTVSQAAASLVEQISASDWGDPAAVETPALFRKMALPESWSGTETLGARYEAMAI